MAYVSTSSLVTAFSHLKQTDYTTARAHGDTYRRLGETSKLVLDVTPSVERDMQNNGGDEPIGTYITTNTFAETALPTYFAFQDIPYWLQMIMGTIGSSGSSDPRTHTVTAINKGTTRQHPVRTFIQREGTDIHVYPSVGLRELRIARDGVGRLTVSITPHGRGTELLNPASYAIPATVNDRVFGYNYQAEHVVDSGAIEVAETFKCSIRSWEWVFTNNFIDDGFNDCSTEYETGNPRGGIVRAEMLTSMYDWHFNCTVRLDSASQMDTLLRSGLPATITTTVTSTEEMADAGTTPYSLEITDEFAYLERVGKSVEENGFFLQDLSFALMADPADGLMSTTAVIVNDKASYTT